MNTLLLIIFPALMAYAACSDLLTMRLSNKLVLITASSFLVIALLAGMPLGQIGWHMVAGIAVLAVTFSLFAAGWIGGGDAKLAAAIALWFGPEMVLPYLLVSAVLGGVLTLAILICRRWMLPAPLLQVGWIEKLHDQKTGIPYGIALALAAMLLYTQTSVYEHLAPVNVQQQMTLDDLQDF